MIEPSSARLSMPPFLCSVPLKRYELINIVNNVPLSLPLQTNLSEARIRLAVGESLIATTSDTVRQWGLAYNNLVLAMKDRRPVNTLSLTRATIDIRDLIKRIREL